MQPGSVKRSVRVAERIRKEIARTIARDLADPRLSHAVVTRVEMPDDLSLARVSMRLALGGESMEARARLLAGLQAAKGLLRKRIGGALGLRRAPDLRFQYDDGQDASQRVEEILDEIGRDRVAKPGAKS